MSRRNVKKQQLTNKALDECMKVFHEIKIDPLELGKKIAAAKAVNDCIKDNTIVGIGSGSTVVYAVDRLAECVQQGNLNVICVPTSFQSRQLIINHNLPLGELEMYPRLDCTIDGADEVDCDLNLIKGGGGCLLQEKVIASCSDQLIIIADHTKNSARLGEQYEKGIPIEVIPMAYVPVKQKIEKLYGGEVILRMAKMKAGPVITDNGNFILDFHFPKVIDNWKEVNIEITMTPGVVETGLFVDMADKAYFGMPDGTVKEQLATN